MKSLSRVRLYATSWTVACQAPPSMGFSRQEYWSGLPFPSPRDLPDPGNEPRFPPLRADSLLSEPPGKPYNNLKKKSSKASILWHSAFFMAQLSYPYTTTGKIIAVTIWTFAGKVMSLLFNMLSKFVILMGRIVKKLWVYLGSKYISFTFILLLNE